MLTLDELKQLEVYIEKKPALTSKNLLKYIRNNYTIGGTDAEKPAKVNKAADAAASVRRSDSYIWNPNGPNTEKSNDAKRGVHIRTQGESERGDETRRFGKRS